MAAIPSTTLAAKPTVPAISWLKVFVVVTLVLTIYWFTLTDLALDWWNDGSQSQGLLIPPLALYIAWVRKSEVLGIPARPDNRGIFLILLGAAAFLLGNVGAEFFLMRVSFVIVVAGLVWTFWGARRLRALAFPFALLFTMVPLPALVYNSVTGPLQLFASALATDLAQLLGTTIYREGNIIYLAHLSLGVEEACSGLNSLSALMVSSLLVGFLFLSQLWGRIFLFLLALPLAIVFNIFRIAATAVLADYHEEFANGFYHLFSGWLVFLMGFSALYLISSAFRRWERLAR